MRGIVLLIVITQLLGCAASTPYAWQDTRQPPRENAAADLEECRAYASRQYRPGIPAGGPYSEEPREDTDETSTNSHGEWRPDRAPFPTTNINMQPLHAIPVDYTGYPGYLDYYPGYLDALLEKCMRDRGWSYDAMTIQRAQTKKTAPD